MGQRSRHPMKWRSALSTFVILAGCSTATLSDARLASAHAVATCRYNQLSVSLHSGGVGLGHFGYRLELTRVGPGTCSLTGYVRATFEDTTHGPATVSARDTKSGYLGGLPLNGPQARQIPVVVLAPTTGKASVLIEGEDVPIGNATSCRVYTTLEIVLTIARGFTQTHEGPKYGFPVYFQDCSQPQVHPIVSGTSGSEN
jgi:hypothetical protein